MITPFRHPAARFSTIPGALHRWARLLAFGCVVAVLGWGCGHQSGIDPSASTVVLSPTGDIRADGEPRVTATITLRSMEGLRVLGADVTVSVSGQNNVLIQPAGWTDETGRVTEFNAANGRTRGIGFEKQ